MSQWILDERLYAVTSATIFLVAAARILGARWSLLLWTAGIGLGFFALHMVALALDWDGRTYRDFLCFWSGGRDTWSGLEAYGEAFTNNRPFLNPPTALPFFAGLAILPLLSAFALWTICNGLLVLGLLPLSRQALAHDQSTAVQGLDGGTVFILAVATALSNATRSNLLCGQLAIAIAFALVLAYLARGLRARALAGVSLALATVKISTMIPFGLLFLTGRQRSVWTWATCLVVLLCLTTAGVADQWGRLKTITAEIQQLSKEGNVNDYSRAGPYPADILGIDKLYYHLGMSDRSHIRLLQIGTLLVLGLALAAVVLNPTTPGGLSASLVALYAVIFLYHRNYDTVLLALPLAFATGFARTLSGRPRFWMAAAALGILLILYLPRKALFVLTHRTFDSVLLSSVVEFLVLPSATWLVLLSAVFLWLGSSGLVRRNDQDA